jgi:hypothetical protein
MVVVAAATLDANAVPAFIIMGVMILYAGIGLLWTGRIATTPFNVTLGYAAQTGLLAGLGAGVVIASGLDILLVALTPTGLDPGALAVAITEIGAAFGLGLGSLIFFRRQRQGYLPDQPITWRRLIAPVVAFAWILLLLIVFFGIGADASLIGLSLLGGAVSGWGLGAMPPEDPTQPTAPPASTPQTSWQILRIAGAALLLTGLLVGALPLWAPLVGVPVR